MPPFSPEVFDYYPPLTKVRNHFQSNIIHHMSLSAAANLAGYETKYFSAYFRHKVGIGFREWATRMRVCAAVERMQRENQTITELALAVGFRDVTTFERAFKKHTGHTPSYFKKHREKRLKNRE